LQSKRIETTESLAEQAYTSISSVRVETTVPKILLIYLTPPKNERLSFPRKWESRSLNTGFPLVWE